MPLPQEVDQDVITFYNELLQEGGLSDEETKLLESIVGKEKVWKKFKSGLHARSLTDRKLDEMREKQKKFEDDYSRKVAELESLRETLATGTDLTKREKEALIAKANALEDKIHKAKQKAMEYEDGEKVIKELGLDGTPSYTPPSPPPEPKQKEAPSEDLRKEFTDTLAKNSRALAKFNFDLLKMRDEHKALTGKELDLDEFYSTLDKHIDEYGGDYNKLFVEKYDIANLRSKRQEDSIREKVRKEMEAEYEKKLADKLLPSEHRSARESDFYKSIEASIPEEEKKHQGGGGMGIDNRSETVGEAAAFMQKLREKRESAQA